MPWTQCCYSDGEPIPNMCYVDDVPPGWRNILLETFRKIDKVLKEKNLLETYKIVQVKEKYGYGRIYDNVVDDDIAKIISEFEHVTAMTCCECGKPAEWISNGWICPWCSECKEKLKRDGTPTFGFKKIEKQ